MFLKERISFRNMILGILCMFGVFLVVQPDFIFNGTKIKGMKQDSISFVGE